MEIYYTPSNAKLSEKIVERLRKAFPEGNLVSYVMAQRVVSIFGRRFPLGFPIPMVIAVREPTARLVYSHPAIINPHALLYSTAKQISFSIKIFRL